MLRWNASVASPRRPHCYDLWRTCLSGCVHLEAAVQTRRVPPATLADGYEGDTEKLSQQS